LETERELAVDGITSVKGYTMKDSNLNTILTNITYTGNLLLQKEYIADPITKKRRKNRGELPQYFVPDTHEAIIDMATFQYVQNEMARRKQLGALANPHIPTSALTSKVKCGNCGANFRRRTENGKYKTWKCATKDNKGKAVCDMKLIPELALKAVCVEVLGLNEFDEDIFTKHIETVTAFEGNVLVFRFYDGMEVTKAWEYHSTARKDCWTPERRAAWGEYQKTRVYTEEQCKARSERAKARWATNPDSFKRRQEG
jgi:hypothetical protein